MVDEVMHWHHIIPKHAGGTDDKSNLVRLTVSEHAEAHRVLYEKHGRWQDKIAWKFLSGQTTSAQANLEANKLRGKGIPKTEEHKIKISQSKMGKKLSDQHRDAIKKGHFGLKHTEETKRKISKGNKGKKIPRESVEKQVKSRESTDGTSVFWMGKMYPTQSQAARAISKHLGISFEAARSRARRISAAPRST
jgi:hypothetical protein